MDIETAKTKVAHLGERLVGLARRAGLAGAVLAALAVFGACWLAVSGTGEPAMATVAAPAGLSIPDAQAKLRTAGIESQVRGDSLILSAPQQSKASAILGQTPPGDVSAMSALTHDGDLWRTESQNAKLWQAAKMSELGRLIRSLPGISNASVILEAGSPRRLGSPGVAPTAAVNVTLADTARMNSKLLSAIGDLVAGSVAGMGPGDVRVVDSTGQSYRPSDASASTGNESLDRIRQAETYWRQKIEASLEYIPDVIVSVRVNADAQQPTCAAACVSVPQSYLRLFAADDDAARQAALDKIRQQLLALIGQEASPQIVVDWFADSASSKIAAPVVQASSAPVAARFDGRQISLASVGVLWLVCVAGLLGRQASRRRRQRVISPTSAQQQGSAGGAFAVLQQASLEQLQDFVSREHPQTIALVLSHLDAARAAQLLVSLPADTQAQVARRIASLEPADSAVVHEVERALSECFAATPSVKVSASGGPGALADMLAHAPSQAQQTLLGALDAGEPAVARTVRQAMTGPIEFEGVCDLPAWRLRPALEAMDGRDLAMALHAASESVRKQVFTTLGSRSSKRLRQELDRLGPVRLSDVEAAQAHVMEMVRLADQGQYIPNEDDGEFTA